MAIEISPLGERFGDDEHFIQNLLERPCGGVAIIRSRAGSSRSHHWHREDAHWLYCLSGEFEYLERPVGAAEEPERRIIRQGELVYTAPRVEHSTYFPVDTVLISMSLRPRDKSSHESDVVRVAPLK
jgi:oxalate decarboxylase/phosphoglucose isomerase-like protein (cupin superfamily)